MGFGFQVPSQVPLLRALLSTCWAHSMMVNDGTTLDVRMIAKGYHLDIKSCSIIWPSWVGSCWQKGYASSLCWGHDDGTCYDGIAIIAWTSTCTQHVGAYSLISMSMWVVISMMEQLVMSNDDQRSSYRHQHVVPSWGHLVSASLSCLSGIGSLEEGACCMLLTMSH